MLGIFAGAGACWPWALSSVWCALPGVSSRGPCCPDVFIGSFSSSGLFDMVVLSLMDVRLIVERVARSNQECQRKAVCDGRRPYAPAIGRRNFAIGYSIIRELINYSVVAFCYVREMRWVFLFITVTSKPSGRILRQHGALRDSGDGRRARRGLRRRMGYLVTLRSVQTALEGCVNVDNCV